jgi:lysophospholipase II
VAFFHGLIADEIEILGPSCGGRIILGGISQGCATAFIALLTSPCRIGAFVGFNGWMPLTVRVKEVILQTAEDHDFSKSQIRGRLTAALRSSLGLKEERSRRVSYNMVDGPPKTSEAGHLPTPIFLSHTANDEVVYIALGKQMRDTLSELRLHEVMWKEHESGGHWIPEPEGFEDLVEFLTEKAGGT